MPFINFNPPFTNKLLEDFFTFITPQTDKAVFLRGWVRDVFPELELDLAYHLPTYFLAGKKLFYFHYFLEDKVFQLELSFLKGSEIEDKYKLFQGKNKKTKSIKIPMLGPVFLGQLKFYIEQSIRLERV